MIRFFRTRIYALTWLLLALPISAQFDEVQEFEGFAVPDFDEKGEMVSQLIGDYAKVLPNGVVEITNLKIEFYELGIVAMTVTAPSCTYHQDSGTASSLGPVRIQRPELIVTGTGFSWSVKEESVRIFRDVRVELIDLHKKDVLPDNAAESNAEGVAP